MLSWYQERLVGAGRLRLRSGDWGVAENETALTSSGRIAAITEVFRSACEELHAQVFTEGADRHGSLVWEAGWNYDGARYLTVSLRDEGAGHIEVWAAAANEKAYSRTLAYQAPMSHVRPSDLREAILRAAWVANAIQPGEPDELVALTSRLDGTA